ncbi:hypothetical protein [Acuticoccus sp.]|uniref:hypothetical protein n=1 Tax=Acuticoccus sp. TaxID=1904378 RepID=UPI003B52185E
MPVIVVLARVASVLYRLVYYVVREFFGLLAAVAGVVLLVRAVLDVLAWRADGDTLLAVPFALALIGLGLWLQRRRFT